MAPLRLLYSTTVARIRHRQRHPLTKPMTKRAVQPLATPAVLNPNPTDEFALHITSAYALGTSSSENDSSAYNAHSIVLHPAPYLSNNSHLCPSPAATSTPPVQVSDKPSSRAIVSHPSQLPSARSSQQSTPTPDNQDVLKSHEPPVPERITMLST